MTYVSSQQKVTDGVRFTENQQIRPFGVSTLVGLSSAILASLLFSGAVQAAPPYFPDLLTGGNKWSFRAYDDADPNHQVLVSAQTVCFEDAGIVGNHQRYTWYSDSFPGWQGIATQEGDMIFMHGEYANGAGHTSIQMETLVSPPIYGSAGTWQEWREDGSYGTTVGFANTRALKEGNCSISAEQAAAQPPLLEGNPLTTDVP